MIRRYMLSVGMALLLSACSMIAAPEPTPTLYVIPTWPLPTGIPTALRDVPTQLPTLTPTVTNTSTPTSSPTPTPTEVIVAEVVIETSTPTPQPVTPTATYTPSPTVTPPQGAITLMPSVTVAVPAATSPAPNNQYSNAVLGITPRVRDIFLDGQNKGNHPSLFSKVGDSISFSNYFLYPIGDGRTIYGEFEYLRGIVDLYRQAPARTGNSFNNSPISAYPGWDSRMLIDPAYAAQTCAGRNPIDCEIDLMRPSVALIMIGTNDASRQISVALYTNNLKQVIEICLARGVIPMLYTLPHNARGDVLPYNAAIVQLASDYQIPLIDYRSLMELAPNRGLRDDGVHPSIPTDQNAANFSAEQLGFGYTIRNLVTLHALDALWRAVTAPPQ